jgi:hypothetical protein
MSMASLLPLNDFLPFPLLNSTLMAPSPSPTGLRAAVSVLRGGVMNGFAKYAMQQYLPFYNSSIVDCTNWIVFEISVAVGKSVLSNHKTSELAGFVKDRLEKLFCAQLGIRTTQELQAAKIIPVEYGPLEMITKIALETLGALVETTLLWFCQKVSNRFIVSYGYSACPLQSYTRMLITAAAFAIAMKAMIYILIAQVETHISLLQYEEVEGGKILIIGYNFKTVLMAPYFFQWYGKWPSSCKFNKPEEVKKEEAQKTPDNSKPQGFKIVCIECDPNEKKAVLNALQQLGVKNKILEVSQVQPVGIKWHRG